MRGLVIFLLALVLIASFSFVAVSFNNNTKIHASEREFLSDFSAFTSAVCEDKKDFVYCKDELFVNCNGKISKAVDVAECNGLRLDMPKVNGFAVFDKDWKDPRNN